MPRQLVGGFCPQAPVKGRRACAGPFKLPSISGMPRIANTLEHRYIPASKQALIPPAQRALCLFWATLTANPTRLSPVGRESCCVKPFIAKGVPSHIKLARPVRSWFGKPLLVQRGLTHEPQIFEWLIRWGLERVLRAIRRTLQCQGLPHTRHMGQSRLPRLAICWEKVYNSSSGVALLWEGGGVYKNMAEWASPAKACPRKWTAIYPQEGFAGFKGAPDPEAPNAEACKIQRKGVPLPCVHTPGGTTWGNHFCRKGAALAQRGWPLCAGRLLWETKQNIG